MSVRVTLTPARRAAVAFPPADTQVVYAPTYAPSAVYGSYAPPAPYYPAMYGYPPGYMATASLLSFGVGVGVGALISDGCDWGDNDVYVHDYNGGGGGGNKNQNVNIDRDKTTIKGDREGIGVLEQLAFGEHTPSGLTGFLDGGPAQ